MIHFVMGLREPNFVTKFAGYWIELSPRHKAKSPARGQATGMAQETGKPEDKDTPPSPPTE